MSGEKKEQKLKILYKFSQKFVKCLLQKEWSCDLSVKLLTSFLVRARLYAKKLKMESLEPISWYLWQQGGRNLEGMDSTHWPKWS